MITSLFAKDKDKSNEHKRYERLEKWHKDYVRQFNDYLSRPWRIFWTNFLAGIAHGLGLILGVTLVLTIVTFLLSHILNQIPFVGDFFNATNIWIQQTLSSRR